MANALSTTVMIPRERASPQTNSRSTTSIVGLAGLSKKNTFVFGRIAASHAALSDASMVVPVIPKRGSRLSISQRHEPNAAFAATT